MTDRHVVSDRASRNPALLLLLLLLASTTAPAAAAPITGTLVFEVDWTDIPFGTPEIQPVLGTPVEITLTYESPSAPIGTFSTDVTSLAARVGDHLLVASNFGRLTLARFAAGPDALLIQSGLYTEAGSFRGNLYVELELVDGFDGHILTSRLPTLDELHVDEAGTETRAALFRYAEEDPSDPGGPLDTIVFTARLESLSSVPEPSTGALLAVGLVWLTGRARSRQRN